MSQIFYAGGCDIFIISYKTKMLIAVPLETIISDSPIIGVETRLVTGSVSNLSAQSIEDIIIKNINIQVALAEFYPYKESLGNKDIVFIIGFLPIESHSLQIEKMRYIFARNIILSKDENSFSCQASRPFDNVLKVFSKLLKQKKLNKWVTYFMLQQNIEDCSNIACYQFISQENNKQLSNMAYEMKKDAFFNYLLYNERNLTVQKCFPISGLSLEEIDNDPYIKAFSKIVKSLYVYISKDTMPDDTHYVKFITWDD